MNDFDTLDNGGGGKLPNAVTVLVLGICSIVGCLFYAVPGLVCGIIALALSRKDTSLYMSDTRRYAESYKLSNAGKICGIIGVSLSALYLIGLIFAFSAIFNHRF